MNGSCEPKTCDQPCEGCTHCEGCSCEPDCDGSKCQKCINGSCEDECTYESNCLECNGEGKCIEKCKECEGDCEVCNGDPSKFCCDGTCCQDGQCCLNGECKACSAWYDEYPNTIPPCPECSDAMGGCYSDHFLITEPHSHYTGGEPAPGEMGICGTPTKHDAFVGRHKFCIKDGLNISPIVACAVQVGLGAYGCYNCIRYGYLDDCWSCLMALIGDDFDCIDPDLCVYITECRHCYDWEDCSVPIEEDIVDWDAVEAGSFCYR